MTILRLHSTKGSQRPEHRNNNNLDNVSNVKQITEKPLLKAKKKADI